MGREARLYEDERPKYDLGHIREEIEEGRIA